MVQMCGKATALQSNVESPLVYSIPNNAKLDEVHQQYSRYRRKKIPRLENTESEMARRRILYTDGKTQKAERSQRSTMLESLVLSFSTFVVKVFSIDRYNY